MRAVTVSTFNSAPPKQAMDDRKNDDDDDNDDDEEEPQAEQPQPQEQEQEQSPFIIEIAPLSSQYFVAANDIESDFIKSGKGCCFGICKFSWCSASPQKEFDASYRNEENGMKRRETYGVAVLSSMRSSNDNDNSKNMVVGICKGRRYDQKSTFMENLLHKPKQGEFYIDTLAVTEEARGKGVGTKLLKWAEEVALEKGDSKLTLGVMKGNPAQRLYIRFGFEELPDGQDPCCVGCMIGRPNGSCVGIQMEKEIAVQATGSDRM
ncbi:MAG: hypothetical protein SGBAC_002936 [Bacillariaceae sp.]